MRTNIQLGTPSSVDNDSLPHLLYVYHISDVTDPSSHTKTLFSSF